MANGVKILKASAGSGKTFALAREYIRLLLGPDREPFMHRHILAVTFTNKATGEMKARIIKELDILARDPMNSAYRADLLENCGYESVEELQSAADAALRSILGDYGSFSVSTIDRFFLQTLRAFSREAGQFSEYQIELDRPSLIAQAVDRVLDSLSENRHELLGYLSENALEQLEQGEGYHLESNLAAFSEQYMSASYKSRAEEFGIDESGAFSAESLRRLKSVCRSIEEAFDREFRAAVADARSFLETFADYPSNANKNFYSRLEEFSAYRPGAKIRLRENAANWMNAVSDGRKAFNAATARRLSQNDADAISERLRRVDAFAEGPYRLLCTARILRGQISLFHIAEALKQEFNALLSEKNVLSLDDTNTILRDIIGGTDIPFIYEKTGVRYHHFLLDEFQDTSTVQWENFLPLLQNSISENFRNLVVGDVKQSIYRWREADWNILDSRVGNELEGAKQIALCDNWRSAPEIVSFNNRFYAFLAERMDRSLAGIYGTDTEDSICRIYSDVQQTPRKRFAVPGSVEISFCDPALLYDETVSAVVAAHERGFAYRDIAVTVRTNAMGADIASRLIAEGIPVVSNDSLRVCSGYSVRRLVSQFFYIDNPADRINTFYAGEFDTECLKDCHSLEEMADALLRRMPADQVNADTLYLLSFMDMLRDFTSRHGNSLHTFLQYWLEEGMNRSIYSPEGGDAVTVITVHRVKGLDYPFVVFPLGKKEAFVNDRETSWELPALSGTPLEETEKALYNVKMTKALYDTLFADNYRRAIRMQYVDSINLAYVASTRASQAMHIIAPGAKAGQENLRSSLLEFVSDPSSGAVMAEAAPTEGECGVEHYVFGSICNFDTSAANSKEAPAGQMDLLYSQGESINAGKLLIKGDADEFFGTEGHNVFVGSRRVRGTVLHGIMQGISSPSDVGKAVDAAVCQGLLPKEDAGFAASLILGAVESVLDRGWFPSDPSRVIDERDICDARGEVRRPDRVVLQPDGSVDIIDYKFGEEQERYLGQVRRYASLYRQLGYARVNAFVWYIEDGRVVKA